MDKIFIDPPANFFPSVEASGCYCEFEDKILLLKRQVHKPYGNTWGVPGGKLERGETPRDAVIREVFEEVGVSVEDTDLEQIGQLYIRTAAADFIFHLFRKRFVVFPKIELGLEEHQDSKWVTISEAHALPLISGGVESLNYYLTHKKTYSENPF